MLTVLFLVLGALSLTTFVGYWTHRAFHSPWAGLFYRAHLNHHIIQYPASNFTSEKYRSAGSDDSLYYFVLAFSPVIIGIILLCWRLHTSISTPIIFIGTMCATGYLHDVIHESFHLNKTLWSRLPLYQRWKDVHWIHHRNVRRNFGVFTMIFDRIFGTYKHTTKQVRNDGRRFPNARSKILWAIHSAKQCQEGIQNPNRTIPN